MRFTSLASGSSGNAAYIGTNNTHILVDAGITMRSINEELASLSLDLRDIQGLFLTHEHSDHIRAVGTIARKYHIPVYGTLTTLQELLLVSSVGEIPKELLHPILPDQTLRFGELSILPFSIYHDAADPVGYRIEEDTDTPGKTERKKAVAVATDMGHYDEYILSHLTDLDAMIIEANHDIQMLSRGPYPLSLKRRILGAKGHLSNASCGELLTKVLNAHTRHVFLGHLSKENNLPELAFETVIKEIDGSERGLHGKDFDISVAKRDGYSEIIEF